MTDDEAVRVCRQWFAHMDGQAEKARTLQQAASLARRGETMMARRLRDSVDRKPEVFDGAYLRPAVEHLVKLAELTEGE